MNVFIKFSLKNFSVVKTQALKKTLQKNSRKIIKVEKKIAKLPDFSDINLELPVDIKIKEYISKTKFREIKPPRHDFINFKAYSGNEIILNMTNYRHFRQTELINSVKELSKRTDLSINSSLKIDWMTHPYVSKVLGHLHTITPRLNVHNHLT